MRVPGWLAWLPGRLWPKPPNLVHWEGAHPQPPFPDLIIACGRRTAPVAAAFRRKADGRTLAVQILGPRMPLTCFDLVIAPAHDGLSGPNVMPIDGAPHDITPALLAELRAQAGGSADVRRPLVAVVLGRVPSVAMPKLSADLAALAKRYEATLWICTSRRTDPGVHDLLRRELSGDGHLIAADRAHYLRCLAFADYVLVGADSVSMTCEAVACGKPVLSMDLGPLPRKLGDFHRRMREKGVLRQFSGNLEDFTPHRPDDLGRVVAAIERLRAG